MKETGLYWLENNIQSDMTFIEIMSLIRQAKEIEKKQKEADIIDWKMFLSNLNILCYNRFIQTTI